MNTEDLSSDIAGIEKLAKKKDAASLILHAANGPGAIRHLAVDALVRLGAPAAKAVTSALSKGDISTRVVVAQVVAAVGGKNATSTLNKLLEDSEPAVRHAAVLGLSKQSGAAVGKALNECLTDPSATVRAAAARSLTSVNKSKISALLKMATSKWPEIQVSGLIGLISANQNDIETPLLDAVSASKHRVVRRHAVQLLSIQNTDSRARLIEFLSDSCPLVRREAVRGIDVKDNDTDVLNALAQLLSMEPSPETRKAAVAVLGSSQNAIAQKAIGKALVDDDSEVREAASAVAHQAEGSDQSLLVLHWIEEEQWERCISAGKAAIPGLLKVATTPLQGPRHLDCRLQALATLAKIGQSKAKTAQVLATQLHDSDARVRAGTLNALAQMGVSKVYESILPLLSDKEAFVRSAAVLCAAQLGGDASEAHVLKCLEDRELQVQHACVQALSQLGALEHLAALRRSTETSIRTAALIGLAETEDTAAIEFIIHGLYDGISSVRETAKSALRMLQWLPVGVPSDSPGSQYSHWMTRRDWVPDTDTRSAHEVLREGTAHADVIYQRAAMEALALDGDIEAIPAIEAQLLNSDADVQLTAAISLSQLKCEPGLGTAWSAFHIYENQWDELENQGAHAIGPLSACLESEDISVRRQAARALGHTKSKDAHSALLNALDDHDASVRANALFSLASIIPKSAGPHIADYLDDKSLEVRNAARKALTHIGSSTAKLVMPMLETASGPGKAAAAETLGQLKHQPAIEPLITLLLEDSSPRARAASAKALGLLSNERAQNALISSLADGSIGVREAAKEALPLCGWTNDNLLLDAAYYLANDDFVSLVEMGNKAVPLLVHVLSDSARDPITNKRRERSAQCLGKIGSKSARSALEQRLNDIVQGVRRESMTALGLIGSETSLAVLERAMVHADWETNRRAVAALAGISGDKANTAIQNALAHHRGPVRTIAARLLGERRVDGAATDLVARCNDSHEPTRKAAYEALFAMSEAAIDALIDGYKQGSRRVRLAAAKLLSHHRSCCPTLVSMLQDSDAVIRTVAVRALGELSYGKAATEIATLVTDKNSTVREAALVSLIAIKGSQYKIIGALADPIMSVKSTAEKALRKAKDVDIDALIQLANTVCSDELNTSHTNNLNAVAMAAHVVLTHRGGLQFKVRLIRFLYGQDLPEALHGLKTCLSSELKTIRTEAVTALGSIAGAACWDDVIETSKEYPAAIRGAALKALCAMDGTRAAPIVTTYIHDPEPLVRCRVAQGLALVITQETTEALVSMLSDRLEEVRSEALLALKVQNQHAVVEHTIMLTIDPDVDVAAIAVDVTCAIGTQALKSLTDFLEHDHSELRRVAALALSGNPKAAPVLLEAASDPNWRVRLAATESLTSIHSAVGKIATAIEQTIQLLWDENSNVRTAGARLIGIIAPEHPALTGALIDNDSFVRQTALEALSAADSPPSSEFLAVALEVRHDLNFDSVTRLGESGLPLAEHAIRTFPGAVKRKAQVADALTKLETKRSGDLLAVMLLVSESEIQIAAANALINHKYSSRATDALADTVRGHDPKIVSPALEALASADPKASLPILAMGCQSSIDAIQIAAARGLAKIPNAPAAPLVGLLANDNDAVREAAATAMGSLKPSDPDLDALLSTIEDPSAEVRHAAIGALKQLNEIARHRLIEALSSPSSTVRNSAVRALAGDITAADDLRQCLEDTNARVRWTAVRTIGSLKVTDALHQVTRLIADPDAEVRAEALVASADLGATESVISGALCDQDTGVRIAANAGLRAINAEPSSDFLRAATLLRQRNLSRAIATKADLGPLLAHALQTDHNGGLRYRRLIASTLSKSTDKQAILALSDATTDRDPVLRALACAGLGHKAAKSTAPALTICVRDTIADVRSNALRALAQSDPKGSGDVLTRALADPELSVRIAAAESVGVAKTKAALPQLLSALRSTDIDFAWAAAEALGALGSEGLKALREVLKAPEEAIRLAAIQGLCKQPEGQTDIVSCLDDDAESVRAAAASHINNPTAAVTKTLQSLAANDDYAVVRMATLKPLYESGNKRAIEQVVAALGDHAPAVQREAGTLLGPDHALFFAQYWLARGEWHRFISMGLSAVPILNRVAENSMHNVWRRVGAMDTLAILKATQCIDTLRNTLNERNVEIRNAAILALAALNDSDSAELIVNRYKKSSALERAALASAMATLQIDNALEQAVNDDDASVRLALAQDMSNPSLLGLLMADSVRAVRIAAGQRMGDLSLDQQLVSAFSSEDVKIREAAITGLRRVDNANKVIQDALLDPVDIVRLLAVEAITEREISEAAPEIRNILYRDPTDSVRLAAVQCLSVIGTSIASEIAPELVLALSDQSGDVQRLATATLDAMGFAPSEDELAIAELVRREHWREMKKYGQKSVPFCIRIMHESGTDQFSVGRRAGAIAALGDIGGKAARQMVLDTVNDRSSKIRGAVAFALGQLGGKGAVDALQRLSRNHEPHVRIAVCRACGILGGDDIAPILHDLRSAEEQEVRLAAATALSGPNSNGLALVVNMLTDRDPELRIKAAKLLGEMNDKAAIEPLIDALGDAFAHVRLAVRQALSDLGWTPIGYRHQIGDRGYAYWTTRASWLERAGNDPNERALLEAGLSHADPVIRRTAVEGIEDLGEHGNTQKLLELLNDSVLEVRETVAHALDALNIVAPTTELRATQLVAMDQMQAAVDECGVVARDSLLEAIQKSSPGAQAAAAAALATLPPKCVTKAVHTTLVNAFSSNDADVRTQSALALAQLQVTNACAAIAELLADPEPSVCKAAAKALVILGPKAQEYLASALEHKTAAVRASAAQGLSEAQSIDLKTVKQLVALLESDSNALVRVEAAKALAVSDADISGKALLNGLSSDVASPVRTACVQGLAKLQPKGIDSALLEALCDEFSNVRTAAITTLEQVGYDAESAVTQAALAVAREDWAQAASYGSDAVPFFARVIRESGLEKTSVFRRTAAIEALGSIGGEAPSLHVIEGLSDRCAPVRAQAARTAGLMGAKTAGQKLTELLTDPVALVRRCAASALGVLGYKPSAEALRIAAEHDVDPGVRLTAAAALASDGIGDIDGLAKRLQDANPHTRRKAVVALGALNRPGAIDPLISALSDSYPTVRSAALEALATLSWVPIGVRSAPEDTGYTHWLTRATLQERHGKKASQMALVCSELQSDEPSRRRSALETLAAIKDTKAIKHILPLLDDANVWVRREAAEALEALGATYDDDKHHCLTLIGLGQPHRAAELGQVSIAPLGRALLEHPTHEAQKAAEALGTLTGKTVIDALIVALPKSSPEVQEPIIRSLATLRAGIEELETTLVSPHTQIQMASACALASLGNDGCAVLTDNISHAEETVRYAVATGLGASGIGKYSKVLAKLLDSDSSTSVRCAAALALGHIGSDHDDTLITALHKDADETVHSACATALGRIGGEKAIEALVPVLSSPFSEVRDSALTALNHLGWKASDELSSLLFSLAQQQWAELATAGKPAVPLLTKVLTEKGQDTESINRRLNAVSTLSKIDHRSVVPALESALFDDAGAVIIATCSAICSHPDDISKTSVSRLCELLENDPRLKVRIQVANALGMTGTKAVLPTLRQVALDDANERLRFAAACAMASQRHQDVSLVISELSNPSEERRLLAVDALLKSQSWNAIDPLVLALSDASSAVRVAAKDALACMNWTPLGIRNHCEDEGYVGWVTREDLIERHGTGLEPKKYVHKELESESAAARRCALEWIARSEDFSASKHVEKLLDDSNFYVRVEAADTLRLLDILPTDDALQINYYIGIGDMERAATFGSSAISSLGRALKEHNVSGRRAAATAMAVLKGKKVIAALEAGLSDDDVHVRALTATALGDVGGGADLLSAALLDPVELVRTSAGRALTHLQGGASMLIDASKHDNAHVRHAGILGIGALGDATHETILNDLLGQETDTYVRGAIISALSELGLVSSLAQALLTDQDTNIRLAAAEALGVQDPNQAIDVLLDALPNVLVEVQQACIRSLNNLGWTPSESEALAFVSVVNEDWDGAVSAGEAAVPLLANVLLEKGATPIDVARRVGAANALAQIGSKAAVHALEQGIHDNAGAVLAETSRCLGGQTKYVRKTVLPKLRQLLEHDGRPKVRVEVAIALGQLSDNASIPLLIDAASKDEDLQVRLAASTALANPEFDQVDFVVQQLNHNDPVVRKHTAELLGTTKNPRAIDPLIHALSDAVHDVRTAASASLESLGWVPIGLRTRPSDVGYTRWQSRSELIERHGDKPLTALLQDELNDENAATRRSAIEAITQYKGTNLSSLILPLLDDRNVYVRKEAAEALSLLDTAPDTGLDAILFMVALGQMFDAAAEGDDAIAPLSRALVEHERGERLLAAKALGQFSGSAAAEALAPGLTDSEPSIRTAVAQSMSAAGAGAKALGAALEDNVQAVRLEAAMGLSAMGTTGLNALADGCTNGNSKTRVAALTGLRPVADESHFELVSQLMSDTDAEVRSHASLTMGCLGEIGISALSSTLESDADPVVRAASAAALGAIGEAKATDALVNALTDRTSVVRESAISALKALGWDSEKEEAAIMVALAQEQWQALSLMGPAAIASLAKVLDETETDNDSALRRAGAAHALTEIGGKQVIAPLERAIDDPCGVVRAAGLRGIGKNHKHAPKRVLSAIHRCLDGDSQDAVRVSAAIALDRFGDKDSVDVLCRAAESDRSLSVRLAASKVLANPSILHIEFLTQQLADTNVEVRVAAATYLGETSSVDAINPLIEALGDADSRVRAAAQASLKMLSWVAVGVRNVANDAGYMRWLTRDELIARTGVKSGQKAMLHKELLSPNPAIRRCAVEALGHFHDQAQAKHLIKLVDDDNKYVRLAVAEALVQLDAIPNDPPLLASIFVSLGRIEDAGALGDASGNALARAIIEGGIDERYRAAKALSKLSAKVAEDALSHGVSDTHQTVRLASVQSLTTLGVGGQTLSAAIHDSDYDVAYSAATALATLGKKHWKVLHTALENENPQIRQVAAQGLRKAADPTAAPMLQSQLTNDLTRECRIAAALALGSLESKLAVTPLTKALSTDAASEVRAAIATALQGHTSKSVEAALIDALGDSAADVRNAALRTLDTMGWEPKEVQSQIVAALAQEDWDGLAEIGEPAVSSLGRVLGERGNEPQLVERRVGAISALSAIPGATSTAMLETALTDSSSLARALALKGICTRPRYASKDAESVFRRLIADDPNTHVRVGATAALGIIGSKDAAELLMKLAEDDREPSVRFAAASSLAQPKFAVIAPLVRALHSINSDDRARAAKELGESENKDAIDPLIEVLGDAVPKVRQAAMRSLSQLDWRPVGVRIHPNHSGYSRWMTRAEIAEITGVDNPDQLPMLRAMTKADDASVRKAGIEGIALTRAVEALEDVIPLLDDASEFVRSEAANTILELNYELPDKNSQAAWLVALNRFDEAVILGAASRSALVRALHEHTRSEDRANAAKALSLLPGKATENALSKALSDDWATVRATAAQSLGTLQAVSAISNIEILLSDMEESTRLSAANSLANMGDDGLKTLARALENDDDDTKIAAVIGIGTMGSDGNNAEALLATMLVEENNAQLRQAITKALSHMEGKASDKALIQSLREDPHMPVRVGAAVALAHRAAPGTEDALVSVLSSSDAGLRAAALGALYAIGWSPKDQLTQMLTALASNEWETLIGHGVDAIPLITEVLVEQSTHLDGIHRRCCAINALVSIGGKSAGSSIESALNDINGVVRTAACKALGTLKWRKAGAKLHTILEQDPIESARIAAATVLGLIGHKSSATLLAEIVDAEETSTLKLAAATALAAPGMAQTSYLIGQLKSRDAAVRAEAASTLGTLSDPEAIDPLIAALGDAVSDVRLKARNALIALQWIPVGVKTTVSEENFGRWLTRSETLLENQDGDQRSLLLKQLNSEDPTIRYAALEGLVSVGSSADATKIMPFLDDSDLHVRRRAAETLAAHHALPSVDTSPEYAAAAYIGLGQFSETTSLGAAAAPALRRTIREHGFADAIKACEALSHLAPNADNLSTLITAIEHSTASVREAAVRAIGTIATQLNSAQALKALKLPTTAILEALDAGIADHDPDVRSAAALALTQCETIDTKLQSIKRTLDHDEPLVRIALLGAIARQHSGTLNNLAIPLLSDGDSRVRMAAIGALENTPKAGNKIIALLADDLSPAVRNTAARAITTLQPKGTQDALVDALGDEEVRTTALAALNQLEWVPESKQRQAVLALAERNWQALKTLSGVSVPLLTRALADKSLDKSHILVRAHVVDTLGAIGSAVAIHAIESALDDLGSPVRAAAARQLGVHNKKTSAQAKNQLHLLINEDPIDKVRIRALIALGQLKHKASVSDLEKHANDDDNLQVRLAASIALGEIGDSSYLITRLLSQNPEIRTQAATQLGKLKAQEAIDPLINALGDAYATVRTAASTALSLIGWTPVGVKAQPGDEKYARWMTRAEQETRLGKPGTDQLTLLAADLEAAEAAIRSAAIEAIAARGDQSGSKLILPLLDDEQLDVRRSAADALRWLNSVPNQGPLAAAWLVAMDRAEDCVEYGKDALAPLIRALQQDQHYGRSKAALALGMIGGKDAASALINALDDTEASVRAVAIDALKRTSGVKSAASIAPYLSDHHTAVRSAAARALAGLKAKGVDLLDATLAHDDPLARQAAAFGLQLVGELEKPIVSKLNRILVDDTDENVRIAVAKTLGGISGKHLSLLSVVRNDPSYKVRQQAATSIGTTAPKGADAVLLKALGDSYESVRNAALEALDAVGWKPDSNVAEAVIRLARDDWAGLVKVGPAAIDLLAQSVIEKENDPLAVLRRVRAVETLVLIGEAHGSTLVSDAITSALTDRSGHVRTAVIKAIGRLKLTELAQKLLDMAANDSSSKARATAASALSLVGDKGMSQALIAIAEDDPSPDVKLAASHALASPVIGHIEPLLLALKSPIADIRMNAAIQLGDLEIDRAIDPLVETLGDAVPRVRAAAYGALEALGWTPVGLRSEEEAAGYSRWMGRDELLGLCDSKPGTDQITLMLEGLKNADAAVRRAALEALGSLGDKSVTKTIIPLLDDSNRVVRRTAGIALKDLSAIPQKGHSAAATWVALGDMNAAANIGQAAVPALLRVLDEHPANERADAIRVMASLPFPEVVEALEKALSDPEHYVRLSAVLSLGKAAGGQAVEILERHLADDHSVLRKAIAMALTELGEPGKEALVRALEHNDPVAREVAVSALGEFGDKAADVSAKLIELLTTDSSVNVRTTTAHALGHIPGCKDALLTATQQDGSWRVREAAIGAAVNQNFPGTAEVLVKCLGDSFERVRKAALNGLKELEWVPKDRTSQAVLALADDDWRTLVAIGDSAINLLSHTVVEKGKDKPATNRRAHAVETLMAIGVKGDAKAAGQAVLPALTDVSSKVRQAAARAAGQLKIKKATHALLKLSQEDIDTKTRTLAALALGQVGNDKIAVPLRTVATDDPIPTVRLAARKALAGPNISDAALLIDALNSRNDRIRTEAAMELGRLRLVVAIDPLIKALSDAYTSVRIAAQNALFQMDWSPIGVRRNPDASGMDRWILRKELNPKNATDSQATVLIGAIGVKDPATRRAVAEGLADIGTEECKTALKKLTSDRDAGVAQIAKQALANFEKLKPAN